MENRDIWGYVNGKCHHLGFSKTEIKQFSPYSIFYEDKIELFIEDKTRVVTIEPFKLSRWVKIKRWFRKMVYKIKIKLQKWKMIHI